MNRRRVPKLLAAGADVTVVAPELHPALTELAPAGADHLAGPRLSWTPTSTAPGTCWPPPTTPPLNARVVAAAEARHTFCVRADQADLGSAWTPATGDIPGATIAVLAGHNPRRSAALRDRIVELLEADDD